MRLIDNKPIKLSVSQRHQTATLGKKTVRRNKKGRAAGLVDCPSECHEHAAGYTPAGGGGTAVAWSLEFVELLQFKNRPISRLVLVIDHVVKHTPRDPSLSRNT